MGSGRWVGGRVGSGNVVIHKALPIHYMFPPYFTSSSKLQRTSNKKPHHDWFPRLPQSSHFKCINTCQFDSLYSRSKFTEWDKHSTVHHIPPFLPSTPLSPSRPLLSSLPPRRFLSTNYPSSLPLPFHYSHSSLQPFHFPPL